jgi:hypothetical protein
MAGAYEEKLSYLPEDLAKKTQQVVKSLYFDVSVPNLLLDTNYAFEFQWLYEDGSKSSWSPGYRLKTAKIPTLVAPKFLNTDLTYFNGILNITWNGQDANGNAYTKAFDRINGINRIGNCLALGRVSNLTFTIF